MRSDQILAASLQKVRLRNEATKEIAPLQDAVDLEMATDDEKAQLTAWKKILCAVKPGRHFNRNR